MLPLFKGKIYGTVTVGARGQLVVPAGLRRELGIKSGDQLIAFGNVNRKVASFIPASEVSRFLEQAAGAISRLEGEMKKRSAKEGEAAKRRMGDG